MPADTDQRGRNDLWVPKISSNPEGSTSCEEECRQVLSSNQESGGPHPRQHWEVLRATRRSLIYWLLRTRSVGRVSAYDDPSSRRCARDAGQYDVWRGEPRPPPRRCSVDARRERGNQRSEARSASCQLFAAQCGALDCRVGEYCICGRRACCPVIASVDRFEDF